MKNFEKINALNFSQMDVEKMKRVKGGYTLPTVTVYSRGGVSSDGSASSDGCSND